MPNRVAQGFLRLFGEKLGIPTRFSYKTIERGFDLEKSKDPANSHTYGKHNFQYSVFATGRSTKIIAEFSSTDDHSIGVLSHFPAVMAQTTEMCPSMDVMPCTQAGMPVPQWIHME